MSFTLNYTGDEINAILARANNGGEIDDELALKAPLASPALTGTPTAPTQAEGDDSTKIATTEYADRAADAAGAAAEAAAKEYTDAATAALYITDTASGSIASFSDGADGIPMKSVKAAITPVQSGSGDPSPDNVRPISGWTGATIPVTGLNVWDEETELGYYSTTDGTPKVTTGSLRSKATNPIRVNANTAYYLAFPSTTRFFAYFYDKYDNYLSYVRIDTASVITTPNNCEYMRFGLETGYGTTYANNISINYPSTDTDYHAYAGQTYSVTWETQAGEVFGGTIDAVSGELTVIHKSRTLESTDSVAYSSTAKTGIFADTLKPAPTSASGDMTGYISNIFKAHTNYLPVNMSNEFTVNSNGAIVIRKAGGFDSLDDVKAYVTDNTVQVCAPLATPVTYLLLPQQITSLLGQNNVWSNTGDTEVTYVADPKLYIAKMLGGGTLTLGSVSPLSVNRPVTISEEDLEQAGEVSEAAEAAAETMLPAKSGETEEEAQE